MALTKARFPPSREFSPKIIPGILTESDPLEGGRGVIVQTYCHCISWEKATTIKMRFSKMLFFLCFRPTIKLQGGSPVDPLFEPPADPLLKLF